jgi:hypothetical protein
MAYAAFGIRRPYKFGINKDWHIPNLVNTQLANAFYSACGQPIGRNVAPQVDGINVLKLPTDPASDSGSDQASTGLGRQGFLGAIGSDRHIEANVRRGLFPSSAPRYLEHENHHNERGKGSPPNCVEQNIS